jgi:hypothetical protein
MPIMNKSGYSMYWNSMWDDKLNYTRSFKDDVFIKFFFYLFIEGGYSFLMRYKIKNIDDHFNYLKIKYNLHILKKKKDENKYMYLTDESNSSKIYLSKIWVLKYQTWIIFYFFTYSFKSGVFFKKKKYAKLGKSNNNYLNLMNSYYKNLIKVNYDYDLYNNYSFNKFSF